MSDDQPDTYISAQGYYVIVNSFLVVDPSLLLPGSNRLIITKMDCFSNRSSITSADSAEGGRTDERGYGERSNGARELCRIYRVIQ